MLAGLSRCRPALAHVDQVFVQKCRELGVAADALFKQLTTTAEDGEDPRGPEPVRPEEPIEGSMGDELPTEAVLSGDDGDDDFPL